MVMATLSSCARPGSNRNPQLSVTSSAKDAKVGVRKSGPISRPRRQSNGRQTPKSVYGKAVRFQELGARAMVTDANIGVRKRGPISTPRRQSRGRQTPKSVYGKAVRFRDLGERVVVDTGAGTGDGTAAPAGGPSDSLDKAVVALVLALLCSHRTPARRDPRMWLPQANVGCRGFLHRMDGCKRSPIPGNPPDRPASLPRPNLEPS